MVLKFLYFLIYSNHHSLSFLLVSFPKSSSSRRSFARSFVILADAVGSPHRCLTRRPSGMWCCRSTPSSVPPRPTPPPRVKIPFRNFANPPILCFEYIILFCWVNVLQMCIRKQETVSEFVKPRILCFEYIILFGRSNDPQMCILKGFCPAAAFCFRGPRPLAFITASADFWLR